MAPKCYVEGQPNLEPTKVHTDLTEKNVIQHALDVFEDKTETDRWLSTPHAFLNEQTPLEAMKTEEGAKKVQDLLYRAEYGMFG